jgi:hypothetical protein
MQDDPLWRRPLVQGLLAAGAVLAVGGTALWTLALGPKEEEPPQYDALPDACSVLTQGTLRELAPRTQPGKSSAQKGDPRGRAGTCLWKEPLSGKPNGTLTAHRVEIGVRLLFTEDDKYGTVRAKEAYGVEWAAARTGSGRSRGGPVDLELDQPFPLKGIGDQAFARPVQSGDPFIRTGKVTVTARTRNVLITAEYASTVQPADEKDKVMPIDTPTARAGAETAAREALAALAACSECAG